MSDRGMPGDMNATEEKTAERTGDELGSERRSVLSRRPLKWAEDHVTKPQKGN